MKRIIVIGSSGAGKSVFARRLAEKTGIELIHLDKLHWKPNWVEPSKDEWDKTVENAVKGEFWIIDGNYSRTLDIRLKACDTVIFLDVPRVVCVWRILKRAATYRKGGRPDLPEGCDEKFNWDFIKLTWSYPNRSKPKVEALLKNFQDEKNLVRLRSRKEVKSFLKTL